MIEFDNFLSPGRKGFLVGIGGVSMSSLAEVLQGMGISHPGTLHLLTSKVSHSLSSLKILKSLHFSQRKVLGKILYKPELE